VFLVPQTGFSNIHFVVKVKDLLIIGSLDEAVIMVKFFVEVG
jgi:hypothetical protein